MEKELLIPCENKLWAEHLEMVRKEQRIECETRNCGLSFGFSLSSSLPVLACVISEHVFIMTEIIPSRRFDNQDFFFLIEFQGSSNLSKKI